MTMKILISNDDGYLAPGLICLADTLREIAAITVIAPDRDRSGASNSLTLSRPIRAMVVENGFLRVDGTPTDCVHLAITGLLDYEPDMVVSGINAGANLGDDVLYSGTVAAAMEATLLGIPAIALSQMRRSGHPLHWATAGHHAADVVRRLTEVDFGRNILLNVNFPDVVAHSVTGIEIDESMRTTNPRIFAVGDVTGEFLLVHVAIYQGEIAARNALSGGEERADYRLQRSHTIFTEPQIAVAGASEKELQRAGTPYVSGTYAFAEHGKAMCLGKTDGFVKMLADPNDGRILGAACIGPEASELIHEVIVAMHFNATAEQFAKIPHLHPTLAEIWTYPAEECAEKVGASAVGAGQ